MPGIAAVEGLRHERTHRLTARPPFRINAGGLLVLWVRHARPSRWRIRNRRTPTARRWGPAASPDALLSYRRGQALAGVRPVGTGHLVGRRGQLRAGCPRAPLPR